MNEGHRLVVHEGRRGRVWAIGLMAAATSTSVAMADPPPTPGNRVSEVTVTAQAPDVGYVATQSRAGSKTDTPVLEFHSQSRP